MSLLIKQPSLFDVRFLICVMSCMLSTHISMSNFMLNTFSGMCSEQMIYCALNTHHFLLISVFNYFFSIFLGGGYLLEEMKRCLAIRRFEAYQTFTNLRLTSAQLWTNPWTIIVFILLWSNTPMPYSWALAPRTFASTTKARRWN